MPHCAKIPKFSKWTKWREGPNGQDCHSGYIDDGALNAKIA